MSDDGLHPEPFLVLDPARHTAVIKRLDADREGRFLVTASHDKTVRVWAAADGRLLRTLRLPAGPGNVGKAYAAAISPDGTLVAAGGWTSATGTNEDIYLFDRASGRLRHRVGGLPNVVNHLAFSPDGSRLAATLGGRNGVRLIDPASGRVVAKGTGYGDQSYGAAFDAAGRLATTSWDGKLRLYDLAGHLLRTEPAPGGRRPEGLAFSPDGRRLAVGYDDGTRVDVLDAASLKPLLTPDTKGVDNGQLSSVAWSADGASLYAAGMWPMDGDSRLRRWPESGRGAPVDVALSRNTVMSLRPLPGGRLAFAAGDPRLGVLGGDGRERWSLGPAGADFRGPDDVLAVSADGVLVRFGYKPFGRSPALLRLAERRLVPEGSAEGLAAARVEAPGLAVEGWENGAEPRLNGKRLALEAYERARSLAIAPDGQRFVLGCDWSLRLFDRAGKEVWRRAVPGTVWAVAVSGDGRLVVAAYGDGTIRWHRLGDGEELLAFYPDGDRERWVLWTPKGYYAASPGGEELIGWQVNRGRDEAPEFFTASRFREQFHRPDVIDLVLEELDVGKAAARADRTVRAPTAKAQPIAHNLPPLVQIVAPADGSAVEDDDVIVRFEIEAGDPVRNVMALVNGRLALRQPRDDLPGGRCAGRLLVPVPPGEVIISVIAENANGASDPAPVRLRVSRRGAVPAKPKPSLHLVASGVSDYQNGAHLKLRFAAKDATDIADRFLAEQGGLYGKVNPWPLANGDAHRRAILGTFRDVQRAVTAGDLVMIFLSGHGASEAGRYYYLPYDAEADSTDAIADTGISHLQFRDAFRRLFEAKAKVIALVDTCYSGDVVEAKAPPPDVDVMAQELGAAENGVVVLTSSTGKEVSRERDDLQNGIFTSALLEALSGAADHDQDRYVTVSNLKAYLPGRVAKLSHNQQHPTIRVPFEKDMEIPIAVVP